MNMEDYNREDELSQFYVIIDNSQLCDNLPHHYDSTEAQVQQRLVNDNNYQGLSTTRVNESSTSSIVTEKRKEVSSSSITFDFKKQEGLLVQQGG